MLWLSRRDSRGCRLLQADLAHQTVPVGQNQWKCSDLSAAGHGRGMAGSVSGSISAKDSRSDVWTLSGVQEIASVNAISTRNCSKVLPAIWAMTWKRMAENS